MMMEKYNVHTPWGYTRECPWCGAVCEENVSTGVYKCPTHGTEPFEEQDYHDEAEKSKQDEEERRRREDNQIDDSYGNKY